jgi:hypothetical protein
LNAARTGRILMNVVMRSSWLVAGGAVLGSLAAGCGSGGGREPASLGVAASLEPSGTTVVASRLTTLEDAIFDQPPSGWYGVAASRDHYLVISQSLGAFVGGYGPRAYVMRDDRVVNPNGTELPGRIPPGLPFQNVAANTGTSWLAFVGAALSVLDLEGNLISTSTLPITARAILWAGDRALVVGAAASAGTYAGIQQGLFLDDAGQPLGDVFDIAPGPTPLHGGAAFDGSRFLIEYSTTDGVFAVGVAKDGRHGPAVQIATDSGDPYGYGLGRNVLSDGRSFLLLYRGSTDDPATLSALHYRTASVDSSLTVTVSEPHIDTQLNANVMTEAYVGDRYLLMDDYHNTNLSVTHDGTPQGPAFTWHPFADDQAAGYAVAADADGSGPLAIDFTGRASRLDESLGLRDDPPMQWGLGPEVLGFAGAIFDGEQFRVEWTDESRASVRTVAVDAGGSILDPGAVGLTGANAVTSGRWLASNGSSVLRLSPGSQAATLTQSDGSVVPVDLSGIGLGTGYNPAVASNGTDYLVAAAEGTTSVAHVSAEGVVLGTKTISVPASANLVFDGKQWLAASNAYSRLQVTAFAADLTPTAPANLLTVPGDLGTWLSLASNGAGALLVWIAHPGPDYQHYEVYASRLSQDLTLLDAPGVLLGTTCLWQPPSAISDGTSYWVSWPEEGTCRPTVRRLAAEPAGGSLLLDDAPVVFADPPINGTVLAAAPGGPVLMVEYPYYSGPLRERVLAVGAPTAYDVIGATL